MTEILLCNVFVVSDCVFLIIILFDFQCVYELFR